jgi:hypothetical protein
MKFLNSDLRVFRAGVEHHLADEELTTRSVVATGSERVLRRRSECPRPLVPLGLCGVRLLRALGNSTTQGVIP